MAGPAPVISCQSLGDTQGGDHYSSFCLEAPIKKRQRGSENAVDHRSLRNQTTDYSTQPVAASELYDLSLP